jgi:hypothetical protein
LAGAAKAVEKTSPNASMLTRESDDCADAAVDAATTTKPVMNVRATLGAMTWKTDPRKLDLSTVTSTKNLHEFINLEPQIDLKLYVVIMLDGGFL